MKNKLIIGTRGSALAIWQTNWVKDRLKEFYPGLHIQIEIIKTKGDKILDTPLSKIGDKNLFTKELEQALIDKKIDLAVHSLKDVSTRIPDGLMIAAITEREDVRDVFVSQNGKNEIRFNNLPKRAKIATGSLRRKCQLLNYRNDLQIVDIRGNLNTRFAKLDSSDWAGMILACAGVVRLGWSQRITDIIQLDVMLPAVGQGAFGIETRINDEYTNELVKKLNHLETEISTGAERALLHYLEGGCQIPIGAYGRIESGIFKLDAMIGSLDGKTVIRKSISGQPDQAKDLGIKLAQRLLDAGGREILEEIKKVEN